MVKSQKPDLCNRYIRPVMYRANTSTINCIFQAKKAFMTENSDRRMLLEKRNTIKKSTIQMNVAISLDLNKGSNSVDK